MSIKNPLKIGTKENLNTVVRKEEPSTRAFNFFESIKSTVFKNSSNNFKEIFNLDTYHIGKILTDTSPKVLEDKGKDMALNLFRQASQNVPAYKKFLKTKGINASGIKTFKDFDLLPIVTKKNYLSKYELKDLTWNGNFEGLHLISVSSGSTGEPFFWPRGLGLEFETTLEYELVLRHFFEIDKKKTLFIIGYAMGMYVAGVFTLNSLMTLVKKNYPLTILSPGADKESILKIVKSIGPMYDQVIIAAYSPVLKDIIDKGYKESINWKDFNLKFISGGEGFSEEFRKYIFRKIDTDNYLKSSMNTYGSADAAILGHETPLSILVRKIASKNPKLQKSLFNQNRIPSLHQYYPFFKYFEEINGNLVLSTFGGVPLIRYSIGDCGGVITFEKMVQTLSDFNIDINKEMKKYGCENLIWKLPFVYLFGRKDNTKIFYGANIYPEHIKNCLEQEKIINSVTGRYYMDITTDRSQNQSFYLAIELAPKLEPTPHFKEEVSSIIHSNLININDEYKYLSQTIGEKIHPTVELFKFEDPKYFSPGIKPKYVKR